MQFARARGGAVAAGALVAGAERVLHFALIGRILKGTGLRLQWNYKSYGAGAEQCGSRKIRGIFLIFEEILEIVAEYLLK